MTTAQLRQNIREDAFPTRFRPPSAKFRRSCAGSWHQPSQLAAKLGAARAADVPEQWHAEAGTTTAGTLGLARIEPFWTRSRRFCRSCAAIEPRSAAGSIARVRCRTRPGRPASRRGRGGVRVCERRRSETRTWMRARAELRQNGGRRDDSACFPLVRGTSAVVVRPHAGLGARRCVGSRVGVPTWGRTQPDRPRPNAREPRARTPVIAVLPRGLMGGAARALGGTLRCSGTVAPHARVRCLSGAAGWAG